jgi:hypothetical protein
MRLNIDPETLPLIMPPFIPAKKKSQAKALHTTANLSLMPVLRTSEKFLSK